MRKIQNILLSNYIEVESTKSMYYNSDSFIYSTSDGSVRLEEEKAYDFFSYYNSLSIGKWKEYTYAGKFCLCLEAKGKFNIEIFGYKGDGDHFRKESGGRYSFDLSEKDSIVITYPSFMKSRVVSFSITAETDTFIYSAYYAAETEEKKTDTPSVSVISDITSPENKALNNIGILNEYLSGDDDIIKSVSYHLIDKGGLLDDSKLKQSKVNVKIHKNRNYSSDKGASHVLYLDEKAEIHPESVKRLFDFLSLLRDEHKEKIICGDVFDEFRQDKKTEISSDNDNNGYKVSGVGYGLKEVFLKGELNEGSPALNLFCCAPVGNDISGEMVVPASEKTITLNGICVFVEKINRCVNRAINKQESVNALTKLHDLIFVRDVEIEVTRHMYYRSDRLLEVSPDKSCNMLCDHTYYDFFTYFNSLSLEKWKKYTYAENIYLVIDIEGDFDIELFGHFKNKTGYQKEWLGKSSHAMEDRETLVLKFPNGIQSSLVSFGIYAKRDVKIYGAYYASDINEEKIKSPLIAMVTTTFKKESYVKKNIELLTENLFDDDEYKDNFVWNIIDNGRTLETGWILPGKIQILPNKNTGGAGGFSKGMMVSLKQEPQPSHILLMDDDVLFMPESFKKLRNLLRIVRDEYSQYFISGAMLKMGQPNIQHEDVGKLNVQGYHEAVKPNYDLNLWNDIVDNEILREDVEHQYGAWWFCCIPVGIARMDNLPLPVFVRGDDVEYSLRNKAKLITMNGICIWHEGFEGKFSGALEYYQVNRNELAVRAMHPELFDVDCIGHIKTIFWEEVYKFNYKGASLLLDAIEDYMKGPGFFKTLDGEKSMKKKRQKDNQPQPLTPEIKAMVDFGTLYDNSPIEGRLKLIYDYTYNGQARIPEFLLRKKTGIIPYGWGYFPSRMILADTIIAVDPTNETYVTYKRSREKFNKIKARYERIITKYNNEHKRIEKEYQDSVKEITGDEFWEAYLS